MFFWNVSALKLELVRAPLTQRAALRYLIATITVVMLLAELNMRLEVPITSTDTVASVAGIIIMLFGTLITYAANGGDRGTDFLGRYFALAWVLGIRNFVGLMLTMSLSGVALEVLNPGSLERPGPFDTVGAALVVLFSGLFYWRMAVHIRQIAFAASDSPA